MRFIFLLALAGSTIAAKAPETDALAKHGLDQLWLDVAKHPNSYSTKCTKRTVARRREWYEINDSDFYTFLT
jgi:hypothetical protein